MTRADLAEHVSERVSKFAVSWKFVMVFLAGVLTWITVNEFAHFDGQDIYLNLVISIATTLLATFILMHENRHRERDLQVRRDHMELTRQIKELLERESHDRLPR